MKSILCCFLLFFCLAYHTQAQEKPLPADTTKPKADTLKIPAKRDIETTVKYSAEDSVVTDMITQEIYLYGKARIEYGDIELTADFITFDQEKNTLFATGKLDSAGRFRDVAKFKQGEDEYEADTMRYNFKTQKAVVKGIVTKKDEGFITSEKAKKGATGEMFAYRSRYTTCNLKHPHWYINASKIKMVPNKQVICGPFNMVVADIPTPLGFAFGMFPLNEKRRSGIVIPTYGEDAQRGFFLRNGGYYWAVNDYLAADFMGGIYTNGSWELTPTFNYLKRYQFTGNFGLSLNRRVGGDEFTKTKAMDFSLRWSHMPQPRGKSSFSANVNLASNNFNQRNNTFNMQQQLSNSTNSGVSYSTSFNIGKSQANLALSATQDQNTGSGVMNVQLPNLNFSINRIYLFRQEGRKVPEWLKNLNIQYSLTAGANFTNDYLQRSNSFGFKVANSPLTPADVVRIDNPFQTDATKTQNPIPNFSLANLPAILRNAQIGAMHTIPLSTSIKLFKHINLSTSLSYREAWFPYKLDYEWEAGKKAVRVDTSNGFHRAYSYSASVGLNTQIFGIFRFGKKSRVEAIRHTIIPSINFSIAPNQENLGYFRYVQVDTTGRSTFVSRFQGFNPNAPVTLNESGSINFDINNIFEAKIRPKVDTADSKKVKLLDNLSFGSSYNLFADSLHLAPIRFGARTNIAQLIDINVGGTLEPYAYMPEWIDETGAVRRQRKISTYRWHKKGYDWLQLANANINFSFNLTPESFKKQTQQKANTALNNLKTGKDGANNTLNSAQAQQELRNISRNPNEYVDFDVPWTLAMGYVFSFNKMGYNPETITQSLTFTGDASLTKTWKFSFSSGYDISAQAFTMTSFNFHKDLHCWEAVFSINPFGKFQSYSFDLRVKASILQDLKISKRRQWFDRDVLSGNTF